MEAIRMVAGWPVQNAAVGVARFDRPTGATGPVRPSLPVTTGPVDRVFAWASVTKAATALAVLVAVEEGTLHLDEEAGPPGSTVRHLLAHASGLGPDPGPPLAAPGTVRVYSNAGYQVLGELLGQRSHLPFADYLGDGVLVPLGMTATLLDPEDPAGPAAAGLSGPLTDLMRLAGEWAVPTLVSAATHRAAVAVQFPSLAGVLPGFGRFDPCDWGLGVEVRGHKQPHWTGTANSPATYGHFGRSGSFLWVDPEAGVICAVLGDRPFGAWAARRWPALADAVLGEAGAQRQGLSGLPDGSPP
jgi:CubicO group peptidase (beta-lactamase class C family)